MALLASALAMAPFFYSGALALPQLIVPKVEEGFLNITVVSTTTVYTDSATDKCASPTTTEYTDSATGECVSPVTVTVTSSTSTSADWETDEPFQPTELPFDEEEDPVETATVTVTTTSISTKADWETNKPLQTTEPPFDKEDPVSKTADAPTTSASTSLNWETNKPVQTTEPPFDEEDPANPTVKNTSTMQVPPGNQGIPSTIQVPPGNPGIPTFYIGPQTITVNPESPATTSRWYYSPPPTTTPMPPQPGAGGMPSMDGFPMPPGFGGGVPDVGDFGNIYSRRGAAVPTTTTTSASASWDYRYGVPPVVASTESAPVISRRHMEPAEDSSKTALPTTEPTGILPPRPAFPAVSTTDNGDVTYGDHWSVTVGSDAAPRPEDADSSDADSAADEDGDDESTQEQPSMSFGAAKTLSGHIVGRPTQPEPETETVTKTMTPSSTRAHKTWGSDSTLRTERKPTTSPDATTTAPILTHGELVPTGALVHDNSTLRTRPHHKTTPLLETTTPASSRTITHRELVTTNGLVYNSAADCTAVVVRIRGALSTLKGCLPSATATLTVAAGRRSAPLPSEECHHHIRNGTTHPPPPHCMKSIDRIDQ
ncbi:hypothetical protein LQW54_009395 [Pestalotiopsis sp. IQ-011]